MRVATDTVTMYATVLARTPDPCTVPAILPTQRGMHLQQRQRPQQQPPALALLALVAANVATIVPRGAALDNGLGLSGAAMGWSSWNHFGNNGSHCHCRLGASGLMEIADAMVSSGLRDAGWRYVNMDGGWASHRDTTTGHLVPDPYQFPDGIKPVVDYIHSKGLLFGICEPAIVKLVALLQLSHDNPRRLHSLFIFQTPTAAARTAGVSIQVATLTGQLTQTILRSGALTSSRTTPVGARPMEVFGSTCATCFHTTRTVIST